MAWYGVYEIATGRLVSICSKVAPDKELADKGLARSSAMVDNPNTNTKKWNPTTKKFLTVAPPPVELAWHAFVDRFTDDEWAEIMDAAANHANATVRKRLVGFIDRGKTVMRVTLGPRVQTVLNQMETAGLIGAGRATEIFNGS